MAAAGLALSTGVRAEPEQGWLDRWSSNVSQTWHEGYNELYVPAYTWHNRYVYDRVKIDGYNEQPWGLGLGKGRIDEKGNWHALYAMAFLDSHKDIEPFAGYAWQAMWYPAADWRVGAGFTVGVTARQDYRYIPFPAVLPLASVEYKRLALQATYVPGSGGAGNVLFTWLRWQL